MRDEEKTERWEREEEGKKEMERREVNETKGDECVGATTGKAA